MPAPLPGVTVHYIPEVQYPPWHGPGPSVERPARRGSPAPLGRDPRCQVHRLRRDARRREGGLPHGGRIRSPLGSPGLSAARPDADRSTPDRGRGSDRFGPAPPRRRRTDRPRGDLVRFALLAVREIDPVSTLCPSPSSPCARSSPRDAGTAGLTSFVGTRSPRATFTTGPTRPSHGFLISGGYAQSDRELRVGLRPSTSSRPATRAPRVNPAPSIAVGHGQFGLSLPEL